MKIMHRISTLLLFLMLFITNSFAAMNGQFKGNIDGNDIDIPVSCQFGGGPVNVVSGDINNPQKDSNKDGIAMDLFFIGEKQVVAIITVKEKIYRFTGKPEVSGSSFAFKGTMKTNNRADYEVDFIVTCKK